MNTSEIIETTSTSGLGVFAYTKSWRWNSNQIWDSLMFINTYSLKAISYSCILYMGKMQNGALLVSCWQWASFWFWGHVPLPARSSCQSKFQTLESGKWFLPGKHKDLNLDLIKIGTVALSVSPSIWRSGVWGSSSLAGKASSRFSEILFQKLKWRATGETLDINLWLLQVDTHTHKSKGKTVDFGI